LFQDWRLQTPQIGSIGEYLRNDGPTRLCVPRELDLDYRNSSTRLYRYQIRSPIAKLHFSTNDNY
jgi:hypothetical protein